MALSDRTFQNRREGERTDAERRDGVAGNSDEGPVVGLGRSGRVVQPRANDGGATVCPAEERGGALPNELDDAL